MFNFDDDGIFANDDGTNVYYDNINDEYVEFAQLYLNNINFISNKAKIFGSAIGISRHWAFDNTKLRNIDKEYEISYPLLIEIESVNFTNNIIDININNNDDDKDNIENGIGGCFAWFIERDSMTEINIKNSIFISNYITSNETTTSLLFENGGAIWTICWHCLFTENEMINSLNNINKCLCDNTDSFLALLNINKCQFRLNNGLIGGAISSSCGM